MRSHVRNGTKVRTRRSPWPSEMPCDDCVCDLLHTVGLPGARCQRALCECSADIMDCTRVYNKARDVQKLCTSRLQDFTSRSKASVPWVFPLQIMLLLTALLLSLCYTSVNGVLAPVSGGSAIPNLHHKTPNVLVFPKAWAPAFLGQKLKKGTDDLKLEQMLKPVCDTMFKNIWDVGMYGKPKGCDKVVFESQDVSIQFERIDL